MSFLLGCAVWSHKDWVGDLFPPGTKGSDYLRLYSRRFHTVEGNTTFYAVPDHATMKRWAAETPAEFRFCFKVPRDITHSGPLRDSIAATHQFLATIRPLGDKLGPTFVQLSPAYGPSLLEDLAIYLKAWPTTVPVALEVRHLDWFREPHRSQLTRLLKELGMARVILDSRPVYQGTSDAQLLAARRKPEVPLETELTSNIAFVRFISHPRRAENFAYLDEWAIRLKRWLNNGLSVYFFVHCPIEAFSPGTARHFHAVLEEHGVPVPPLPWNQLPSGPSQLGLFA